MSLQVGQKTPAITLEGVLHKKFSSYTLPKSDGSWTVLIFYPLDFTFVCPTEIVAYSDAIEKFNALNTKVFGISVDSKFSHLAWTETDRKQGGVGDINFPLLADLNKDAAQAFGILSGAVALRGLFLIDNEGVLQHATINNLGVGRSVEETLRIIEAFQYTKETGDVCPANWHKGKPTMKPDPSGLKEYAQKHG
jgi:peroxiredoxin (alkyl hydroperoxide reductase subunit C)